MKSMTQAPDTATNEQQATGSPRHALSLSVYNAVKVADVLAIDLPTLVSALSTHDSATFSVDFLNRGFRCALLALELTIAEFARTLGHSPGWLSYRLSGRGRSWGVDDAMHAAHELGFEATQLMRIGQLTGVLGASNPAHPEAAQ